MKIAYTWLTRCFVAVLDFRKYLGNDMSGKSLTKLAENIGYFFFIFLLFSVAKRNIGDYSNNRSFLKFCNFFISY